MFNKVLRNKEKNLAKYIGFSLINISEYLGIKTKFLYSSNIKKNNDLTALEKILEIAKILNQRLDGVKIVNDKPQIVALIDVLTLTVELDIRSVYIYGRYQKLERGIPQTRWPCRACKGRGCPRCNETGLQYFEA